MVLISGEIVFTKVIMWRRNNDFHFSPKGKNGAQNAICPSGVKTFFSLKSFQYDKLMKCDSLTKEIGQLEIDLQTLAESKQGESQAGCYHLENRL